MCRDSGRHFATSLKMQTSTGSCSPRVGGLLSRLSPHLSLSCHLFKTICLGKDVNECCRLPPCAILKFGSGRNGCLGGTGRLACVQDSRTKLKLRCHPSSCLGFSTRNFCGGCSRCPVSLISDVPLTSGNASCKILKGRTIDSATAKETCNLRLAKQ